MSNSKKRQHESVDYIKQHKEKVPAGGEEASITQGLQSVHLVDAAGGSGTQAGAGQMMPPPAVGSIGNQGPSVLAGAAAAYEAAKKKLAHKASFTEVGSDVEAGLMPPGVAWRVDVVRWKIAQDNASRQFATYLLKVSSDTPVARTWYLYRRYNDFSTLKAELKKAGCTLSTLPSKGVFTFGSHLGAGAFVRSRGTHRGPNRASWTPHSPAAVLFSRLRSFPEGGATRAWISCSGARKKRAPGKLSTCTFPCPSIFVSAKPVSRSTPL